MAYAELVYKNGFQTKHIPTELKLLILYFRDILKYSARVRKKEFELWCNKYIPDFSIARHYRLFDKILAYGSNKKNRLIVVKEVPIYKEEFEYINSLDIGYNHKKVLFTFLVQNKLNKIVYKFKNEEELNNYYFKGGRRHFKEIKEMSKIPSKIKILEDIGHDLHIYGYIESKYQGLIELHFIKKLTNNSNILFYVRNFHDTGWYFDYYNSDLKIKLCKECGEPFKISNNKQKYCNQCAKIIKNEQNKSYYHLGK